MKLGIDICSSSRREAHVQSLTGNRNLGLRLALLALALLLAFPDTLKAAPPD